MSLLTWGLLFGIGLNSAVGVELSRRVILPNATTDTGANSLELCWGFNDTHVEVQLSYPTLGWLTMGLSPNGGMDQSDVLFGYVNDTTNEVVIQDRFLTADMESMKIVLSLDKVQNWQMVSGSKNDTYTVLRAVRKIKACDNMDRSFTNLEQAVIYSYHSKLPDSPTGKIRKHSQRGQTTVNFLRATPIPDPDIANEITKTLEFRIDNRTVSGKETQYSCKLTALPVFDKKYQSIASQPIINKANMKYIHHMLVYVCMDLPAEYAKKDFFACGPTDDSFVMKYCQNMIGGWAMGAKETNYQPADVGSPFTPEMTGMKVVVQIHYNNPDLATFVDDSGMRFLLTDQVRKYDSGTIMAGIFSLDFTLTMPPGLETFHVQGQCSDQCTRTMLPEEGINIFASNVHMHTRGKSGVARHFRGNQEILPPLGQELAYDFNFQSSKPLIPNRKFLPGDRIIVECNFTTINDTKPVYGGEGTMEEMCLIFLSYYPKSDLSICGSQFQIKPYLKALGMTPDMLIANGGFPKARLAVAAQLFNNLNDGMKARREILKTFLGPVNKFIAGQKWDSESAKPLQSFYSDKQYLAICRGKGGNITIIPADTPPEITFYVDPSKLPCTSS
ncbi:DBH-like monooxygenase protein 1-like protein [Hypsibius exemplaris]|uniref:DBH-like monooxygenase protein 1-like protein n=1 Tax=Hypsibius exemplaris TaxID=2072580 RepID=A0A9X6N9R1_HYPEX|nr:DBH-like monooxygenase protein 1-like protein [Hypsibius exemplaris]